MNNDLLKLLSEGWLYIDDDQMGVRCNHSTLSCTDCPVSKECEKLNDTLIPEEIEYLRTYHPELFI